VQIPIENIYYLLCYAWDKLPENEIVNVDPIDATNLVDLFARVLAGGTRHLLKRGFDRGYVPQHDWTGRLRGRLDFQEAVRTNSIRTGRLPCDFDELSYDVLHNQLLKATMRSLIHAEGLALETSESMTQLVRQLSIVQDVRITNRLFGQVQLHRNNQFYDFLLKICELIHRNLLVSEKTGHAKFMDFVRDRRQMAILYESFIRNFYRINSHYRVKREDIVWRWAPADQTSHGLLPKMQTDVSLSSDHRKIIIDCKFTPEATQHHYEAETLRSAHLYQIHAYLSNLPAGKLSETCEIMLLYPTVGSPLRASYTDLGRQISIRTINLNQPWQAIHADLLALVA
jgi:5-methylcytosine-specific restriction enzyme subunit McrC